MRSILKAEISSADSVALDR